MKKIKSIKHLRAEKRKLQKRKSELEEKIKISWTDMKRNFINGKFQKNYSEEKHAINDENSRDGFFDELFTFLAGQVVHKMAGKAEEKFGEWLRK